MGCFVSIPASLKAWWFRRNIHRSKIYEALPQLQAKVEEMAKVKRSELEVHESKLKVSEKVLHGMTHSYFTYMAAVAKKTKKQNPQKERIFKAELLRLQTIVVNLERQSIKLHKSISDLEDKSLLFAATLNEAKAMSDNYELQKLIAKSGMDSEMMSKVADQQMEMEARIQASAQDMADRQMASANMGMSNTSSADVEVQSRLEELLRSCHEEGVAADFNINESSALDSSDVARLIDGAVINKPEYA